MNDVTELSERLNEMLASYTVRGEDGEELLVDLDKWGTADLLDMLCMIEQVIEMRGEEVPMREAINTDYGEYDALRINDA